MKTWNQQPLDGVLTPHLGFTLPSAGLIPAFIKQALESGLFSETEHTQLFPLDDVKDWLRQDPHRPGASVKRAREALLSLEKEAEKKSRAAGQVFDLVNFELEQMRLDESWETFDPTWCAEIFDLIMDEADELQAWARTANSTDLSLAASFSLPYLAKDRKAERHGSFQVDLTARGQRPVYARGPGAAFVRVLCEDQRVGDSTDAHLALAYPLVAEDRFLATFDSLRQTLTLKGA